MQICAPSVFLDMLKRRRAKRAENRKIVWVALLSLIGLLSTPLTAAAHPLGNFTVNHYSRIEIYSDQLRVFYVLDMAEIPAFQEMSKIDLDGDGEVGEDENEEYRLNMIETLRQGLRLEVDGAPVELQASASELTFPPGQGDLKTLRLSGWYEAPLEAGVGRTVAVTFRDDNFGERIGWSEIVVRPADGIRLDRSDAAMEDTSNELRVYPEDMLSSPLDQRQANVQFQIVAVSNRAPVPGGVTPATVTRTSDPFAKLIHVEDLGPGVLLAALLAAMAYGALHAFTPGHGKAMVGAYLVGARGTPRHAILLGLTVTATHTIGVYLLGFVTLFAAQYILPERLFPVLGTISGVMVVAIGGSLFVSRLRGAGTHALHHHDHEHDHHAEHVHAHHEHGSDEHAHDHGHHHLPPTGQAVSLRNLLALGVSGGLIPCPSALLVMLGAIALNRVALGLVLIVAFSSGLALVLTVTGLLLVYAGRLFDRFSVNHRVVRLMSAGSALLVTAIGIAATVQSLMQLLA